MGGFGKTTQFILVGIVTPRRWIPLLLAAVALYAVGETVSRWMPGVPPPTGMEKTVVAARSPTLPRAAVPGARKAP